MGGAVKMEQTFEYFAFISYKREDEKWAKWLQHKLETYKLPTVIANEIPDLPKRIKPVFKDTTDIKPGALTEVLQNNLQQSKYLIVICSPLAAKSVWVGKEISDFIALERVRNIILFIVDGEPYSSNPERECYHPVIKEQLPEMLGVNIHEEGKDSRYIKKQKAFIRIVSVLLDVSFDTLWQRQKRRIIRNRLIGIFTGLFFVAALTGVSTYQYHINQPFDVRVTLKGTTIHNPNLPFENGLVKLYYDKDTLVSKSVNAYEDIIAFTNIPGKFRGKNAQAWFEMFGYEKKDSSIFLAPFIELHIQRDKTFASIEGTVMDYNGNPLPEVQIFVENKAAFSNENGKFEIHFELDEQRISKEVTISKEGYKTVNGKFVVGQNWKLLLEKK